MSKQWRCRVALALVIVVTTLGGMAQLGRVAADDAHASPHSANYDFSRSRIMSPGSAKYDF